MKRLMSIIMTFSLCLSLFPAWALAADPDPGLCAHHTEHTEECGYVAAEPGEDPESGHPCEYICKLCPLEVKIAELPDRGISADNRNEIQEQLNHVLELYAELTEEEQDQIDIKRCQDLQATLDATNSPAPAADELTATFFNKTLTDGCYTPNGDPIEEEYILDGDSYLEYHQGVLTIHGNVDLDIGSNYSIFSVENGTLTITGSKADSLTLRSNGQSPIAIGEGASIVLDGAVNFTVEATAVPEYTTAESYSGTVTVNDKTNGGKSDSSDSTDQAVAEFINGDTTTPLTKADFANTTTISNAFSTGGTIKLLADVTMPSFDMTCRTTTLDLNGHTLRNTDGSDAIHLTNGGLTIQDSSDGKTGKIESTANGVNVTSGYLEIKSGTFTSTSGKAFIIKSDSEQSPTSGGGRAVLSGGTFSSIESIGSSLRSKLKEGFAFYQNGQILTTGIDSPGVLSDVTIQSCSHVYDSEGTCQACGTKALALVTIGDKSTGYGNIQDAWNAANGKTATLKILNAAISCDVGDGLTLTGGNITLEMEDYASLTVKNFSRNPVITVGSGTLTIESADIDGSSMGSGIEVNGGTLNVKSHSIEYTSKDQTFQDVIKYKESTSINGGTAISVRGGEVNVSGGSISGTNCGISLYDGVYVGTVQLSGGTVQLSGGTVGATAPKSAALCNYKKGGTVADMLAPGYGLRKQTFNSDGSTSDGDWVNTSTDETETGRFNVEKAPFAMDAVETVNAYYGQTITLNAKVTDIQDGRTVSYQWADSNGTIANATAATYTLPGNLDVGTYTYTCTATSDDGYTKTKTITVQIAQSGAEIGNLQILNGDTPTTEFGSGDTITVKVKVTPTGSAPSAPMRAARAANQMALYVGTTQVSEPANPDADGVYTMTVAVPDLLNATGQNADGAGVSITLTARYTGNDNLGSVAQTFSVTVTDDNAATNNDAAIVDADGTIVGYIATLNDDAFNSKSKDKTIKLLRNVVKKSIYIKSSYTFTLDLNGHTIEDSFINLYAYNPTLTIQDSAGNGAIKCNNNNFPIKVDCGSLTIDGGTFRSDDTTTIYVRSGNLTINGGKVTSGYQQTIAFYGNELTIHDGTFENASSTGDSNSMGTIYVGSANTATIDGGTFNSNTSASALLVANSKLVQISGGIFRGTTDLGIDANYRHAIRITQTGKTVGDLLAPGYAFKKNGDWVNNTNVQALATDQNTPVTVEKAPFTIAPTQPTEQLHHGLAGDFKLQMNATPTSGGTIAYQWQDTTDAANPQDLSCTADACPLDLNALAAKTYTYTCTASCDGYSVSHAFTFRVADSGTTFQGGVQTYKSTDRNNPTTKFTTDDTITVQVDVQAATGGTSTNALRAAPGPNQIALFVGETQVGEPVSKTDTIQIAATALLEKIKATPNGGPIPLTVKFVGDNNMADHQETVDITITADAELCDSNGNRVGYAGALSNAFTEANDGKTIKLLRDISSAKTIEISDQADSSWTLDLNGHTIHQKTGETDAVIFFYGGKLTIQDSSTGKTGIIEGYQAVFYYSGNLKLMGGTFKSADTAQNCAVATMGNNAVKNLLEKGYAFYDRNGNLITDQGLLSANRLAGPVTVKECTHTGLTELADGVNHGGTCPICDTKLTEEPHDWNSDPIPTCTACGATAVIKVQPYNDSNPWRYLSNLTSAFKDDSRRIRVLLSDVDLDGGSVESTISGTKLYLNGHSIKNGEFHISGGSLDINIPNRDKPDGVADGGSIDNLHVDYANGANLYGGTYGYIQVDNKGTVGALLEKACQVDDKWQPGYAFYDASDNLMISDETLLDQPMITNVTVKPCTHHFGEDDVCTVCGYQHVYVVSVEINGTTTYYVEDDIYKAWAAAQEADSATVTLLSSVNLDELAWYLNPDSEPEYGPGLQMTKGNITLTVPVHEDEDETTGETIYYPEMNSIGISDPAGTIQVSGGTLTLENAFINNNGDGPAIDVSGGKLIVPETYFFMGPYMNVACMAMKGGAALYVHDGGQAELSGGMFAGIPSIQSDVPVLRTLKTDYAFCNLNMETGEFYWRYDTSGTELDGLIYVLPAPVTFTEQPKNTEIPYGETPTLSVKPELTYPEESTEDMITYQWYEITADPDDPTRAKPKVIDGATQSTYKPQGLSAGTHVYACGVFFVENNYSGYIAMSDFATVTVTPKELTPRITVTNNATEKVYDGTIVVPVPSYLSIQLSGVLTGDEADVQATVDGYVYDSADVGNRTITANNVRLEGSKAANYTLSSDSATIAGTITPKTVSNPTIELTPNTFEYDGTAKTATVVVKDGETVIPSSEYELAYSDNTNVGTASVTITDKAGGNYTVNGSATFAITQSSIADATVKLSPTSYIYDGTAKTPAVTVEKNGKALNPKADYTVAYTNNIEIGDATITITGKGNYTGTITATFQIKPEPIVPVPVTGVKLDKDRLELTVDDIANLTATITPEDADNQEIEWSSSDPTIATVDQTGKITAMAPGETTITVTTKDGGFTATCNVTVSPKDKPSVPVTGIRLNKNSLALTVGDTETLTATIIPDNATNRNVTWSSGNPDAATVDQTGKITAIAPGVATITATTVDGNHKATCNVTVRSKDDPYVPVSVTGVTLLRPTLPMVVEDTERLIPIITPENADNQDVTWDSSNPAIATVDETGNITAIAPGTATITVTTVDGGFTATCTVTVRSKDDPYVPISVTGIKLNHSNLALTVEDTERLIPIITPEDADNQDVTWISSNPAIATVDETGKITAIAPGTTTITATTVDGNHKATCTITVKARYHISGIVLQNDKGVPEATVTLKQGNTTIAEWTTDANGHFDFKDIPSGVYNLIVEKDGITKTVLQEISDHDAELRIILPSGKTNSVVEIKNPEGSTEATPSVVVGGLDEIFTDNPNYTKEDQDTVSSGGSVEFKLIVEQKTEESSDEESKTAIGKIKTETEQKGQTVELFLDLSILKTVKPENGEETSEKISNTNHLIETRILLPEKLQGKENYVVYRVHDGKLEALPNGDDPNSERYEVSHDKTFITIYARNYSLYAIAYSDSSDQPEPPTPVEPEKPTDQTPSSSNSNGTSGTSSVNTYAITIHDTEHGSVTASRDKATGGNQITLTVKPDSGYVLDKITATDSRENSIKLTGQNGTYRFTMPARAVDITAVFALAPADQAACDGGEDCPSRNFTDLGGIEAWYHEAVDYVLKNNLMNGYGNGLFGPNNKLSRAHLVQILYNQAGRPVVNYLLQYSDVADGSWYTEAIRWATSQGIVSGYSNGLFGPNNNITREQLAVILWRYAGSPAVTDSDLSFTDANQIGSYALDALRWAVKNGIINGKSDGTFDPKGSATRAQTAQMFRNYLVYQQTTE